MRFVDKNRLPKRSKNIGAVYTHSLNVWIWFCQNVKWRRLNWWRVVLRLLKTTTRSNVDLLGLVKGLKEENKMLDAYRRIEMLLSECFPVGAVFIQLRWHMLCLFVSDGGFAFGFSIFTSLSRRSSFVCNCYDCLGAITVKHSIENLKKGCFKKTIWFLIGLVTFKCFPLLGYKSRRTWFWGN